MPIFEYDCVSCGTRFEELVRSSDDEERLKCPSCGGAKCRKAFSTFAMSGGSKSAHSSGGGDSEGSSCTGCRRSSCAGCH